MSRPSDCRTSMSMALLFRWIWTQVPDWSPMTAPVSRITSGTPTFSTRMTSAPCSASWVLAHGPATAPDTSTTLIPASGPCPMGSPFETAETLASFAVAADEGGHRVVPPWRIVRVDGVGAR